MPSHNQFLPGLQLNKSFFLDVVRPLLAEHFPQIVYSAALIGYGSDVLGLDTAISMDHNWGPRLQLFLAEDEIRAVKPKIDSMLREQLPTSYKGFSANFTDQRVDCTQSMLPIETGPVNHLIQILTIPEFVNDEIGFDLSRNVTLTDWLAFPEQGLIELTRGAVFYDGLHALNHVREQFDFYPDDVWRVKMAVLWHAIAEEEAFIGRNHDLDDALGAHIITSRIVNHLMKLCFYLERRYIPYSKWLGTAFNHLNCAPEIGPVFAEILKTEELQAKESRLADAYAIIGRKHNALHLTETIDFSMRNYYGRPYQVLFASRLEEALRASLKHSGLKTVNISVIGMDLLVDGIDMSEQKRYLREFLTSLEPLS